MVHKAALDKIRKHQTEAPIQMVPLAGEFGLDVYKAPHFPDNLSGMIKREDGEYKIYVNAQHAVTRRRFTIAHELAHYILHKDLIEDGIVDDALYRSGLGSNVETEANKLATDILMPWHLLKRPEYEKLSVFDLAKKFWVSEAAMSIRLGVPAF